MTNTELLAQLQTELASLREKVARLEATSPNLSPVPTESPTTSRRRMLKKMGAVAAGLMVTGALGATSSTSKVLAADDQQPVPPTPPPPPSPPKLGIIIPSKQEPKPPIRAVYGDNMRVGYNLSVDDISSTTGLFDAFGDRLINNMFRVNNYSNNSVSLPTNSKIAIAGTTSGADVNDASGITRIGVYGGTDYRAGTYSFGVYGYTEASPGYGAAVSASSPNGADGVYASSTEANGVLATSSGEYGAGVLGQNTGTGTGVRAYSANGIGLYATSNTSYGIYSQASNIGVWGNSSGNSGVYGSSTATSGTFAGVYGYGNSRYGIYGESNTNSGIYGTTTSGVAGVYGSSSDNYGAYFYGGKAPLCLSYSATTGAPPSGNHQKGELYVDSNGTLWTCVTSGTPGTWRIANATISAGPRQTVTPTATGYSISSPYPGLNILASPERYVDTRSFVAPGDSTGIIAAGTSRTFKLINTVGQNGVTIPSGATAVVGNLTAVPVSTTTGSGFLRIYAEGATAPIAANLNYSASSGPISNSFLSAVSNTGYVRIFALKDVHVVVDVAGYYV